MAFTQYIALFCLLTTISWVQMQTVNHRLPTIYRPRGYRVHLNLTSAVFSEASNEYHGMVIINFTTTQTTNTIQLHAHHEFIRINLITLGSNDIDETAYSIDNTTDILTINIPGQVTAGFHYSLIIDFTGQLSTTEMTGFYKSSYVDGSGVTTYLATTQFQPTSARRAFPCFDEPFFKATFDIYITYPHGLNALSNTPGSIYTSDDVSETKEFERTAVMSTYLIAFIISNFTCTQGESIGIVPYQICSREEASDSRAWAVEIGPKLLESLNRFTLVEYSEAKEKLDQVAIPDFAAGAMENWGLVTYREIYLLWDPLESSNRYKQQIATIIAHEFAHFWFGNLVTCNWWSETFLNEGYATYFEYFTTHDVLPEWQLDKQFVVDIIHSILITDALENNLALQSEASTLTEVMAKFGRTSYSKGGAIYRMVEHFTGTENFRRGLRNYLHQHEYTTTLPENLWAALNGVIDNSITRLPAESLEVVMENWVKNPGFPLLSVSLNGTQVTITQERFLLSGSDSVSKWYVPITYTTSEDANKFVNTLPNHWLLPTQDLTFTLPSNVSWIIVNNQQTAFARVTYDDALWNNIRDALRQEDFGGIHELNRANIVDDLFNLARVDKIRYSRVFNILEFLANDTSYFTWVPALNGYNFLLARVGLTSFLGQAISAHVLELITNYYESVSLIHHNDEDQIYTFGQVLAHTTACRLGHSTCINLAQLLFSIYRYGGPRPIKNTRSFVYCNGLRHSTNQSDWEFLWNAYLTSNLASEQATILSALGCSQDVELLERFLHYSITPNSGIRSQDSLSVFSSVYNGNPIGVEVAFKFLTENHELINERYLSLNALPNLINGIAGVFTTQEQVDQKLSGDHSYRYKKLYPALNLIQFSCPSAAVTKNFSPIGMLKEFIESGGLPEEYHPSATTAVEAAEANLEWLRYFEEELLDFFFPQVEEEGDGAGSVSANILIIISLFVIGRSLY